MIQVYTDIAWKAVIEHFQSYAVEGDWIVFMVRPERVKTKVWRRYADIRQVTEKEIDFATGFVWGRDA